MKFLVQHGELPTAPENMRTAAKEACVDGYDDGGPGDGHGHGLVMLMVMPWS